MTPRVTRTLITWRMIFFINLPVGAVALLLLARTQRSPHRPVPFDKIGQATAVLAMGGLTYGALLADHATFMQGLHASLLIAAGGALTAAAASLLLLRVRRTTPT